jgi:hypothetical protein
MMKPVLEIEALSFSVGDSFILSNVRLIFNSLKIKAL